ncbi:hypothetical protein F5Y15DRAFT_421913 [Xylariaceae sp. FL0016]|nr:hypothetical protein F5Y15DRAFT_421913 [Xylariaceae sp. FL0016]
MRTTLPSIQSFHCGKVPPTASDNKNSLHHIHNGDGFTSSEIEAAINPLSQPWRSSRDYESCSIAQLQSGPHNYLILGRLVNFSPTIGRPKTKDATERYFFLVLSDGSGVIAVKLFYPATSNYQPILGQRVSIYATYIANAGKAEIGHIPYCASATTIYPGRNGATHVIFHTDQPSSIEEQCLRVPLEVDISNYDYLPGLMTLKSFISSGFELSEGKILVCVRSIGPLRTIRTKKREEPLSLIEVGIFDDTENCLLKLWQDKVPSAKAWTPNKTILLISLPTCRVATYANAPTEIGITYSTMICVDPEFPEADWLRKKLCNLSKRDEVPIRYPDGTWDIDAAMNGPRRTLYTIAQVEDQVRHQLPSCNFTGKLNVIILSMNLMAQWRKNAACCIECCGIPLYANKPVAMCKNCGIQRELSMNPRILGALIDESGTLEGSKLVWNDSAWTQLLFPSATDGSVEEEVTEADLIEQSWEDIAVLDMGSLRCVEHQLFCSRVTLTFGWSHVLGRLCILGVEW